jgi:hypothetical protein
MEQKDNFCVVFTDKYSWKPFAEDKMKLSSSCKQKCKSYLILLKVTSTPDNYCTPSKILKYIARDILGVQMKSWAGKTLETVNRFAFFKCKLTVVKLQKVQKIFLFFYFFAIFYIKNKITNDSYSRSKYLRTPFAENKHVQ